MTRLLFVGAAAVAALAVGACGQKDAADTTANPGQTPAVNAAQDAVGAAVGATSAATLGSNTTGGFVMSAAISDLYEVEAGKLAQTLSKTPDIQAFGKMMVADHTASTNELKPLAAAAGETPPAVMDERRQGMIDNLKAAGANFDKVYTDQQVAAHKEALTLLQGYAGNGADAGLKAFAAKLAPKVEAHLAKAQALQAAASGN